MTQQIERLTGAQRVRRRPAVLFGSDGSEGVMCLLDTLLNIMSSECRNGYASRLVFTRYADGSMELQDNGRGLYLGSGQPEDDHIWKSKFCEILCGSAYGDSIDRSHEYSYFEPTGTIPCRPYESECYRDFDLCAAQYVCAFMDVAVCRDGLEFSLHFEKGEPVGSISCRTSTAPSGTTIRFRPDAEVFTCVAIDDTFIPEQLRRLALLTPNCTFLYREETDSRLQEQVFCFPEGIVGDLEARRSCTLSTPVYTAQIAATGKDRYNRAQYGAQIQVALCFMKDGGGIDIYHNRRILSNGGLHLERILCGVQDCLQWQLDSDFPETQLRRHLRLTVQTTTTPYASNWTDGRQSGIRNTMIADMAQDCIRDNFSYYIKTNHDTISKIFGITP